MTSLEKDPFNYLFLDKPMYRDTASVMNNSFVCGIKMVDIDTLFVPDCFKLLNKEIQKSVIKYAINQGKMNDKIMNHINEDKYMKRVFIEVKLTY